VYLRKASALPSAAGLIAPELSPGTPASPPEAAAAEAPPSSGLPAMVWRSTACSAATSMRTKAGDILSTVSRRRRSSRSASSRWALRTAGAAKLTEACSQARSTARSMSGLRSSMAVALAGRRSSVRWMSATRLPSSISSRRTMRCRSLSSSCMSW